MDLQRLIIKQIMNNISFVALFIYLCMSFIPFDVMGVKVLNHKNYNQKGIFLCFVRENYILIVLLLVPPMANG